MTIFEQEILNQCGWSEKQQKFLGVMIHKLKNDKADDIAHIVIKVTEKEIEIEFAVPNNQGQKMNCVLDKETQSINVEKTDQDIRNKEDFTAFLKMVEATIKGHSGIFMPTKKIESNIEFNYNK